MSRKRETSELVARKFPNVGELFDGRYQLEVQLGSGGGSAVFKALDTRLSRQVAIKVLLPDEMDTQGIERFRREAISIARLTHSGIVTIYDFSEAGKLPYLVLELVNGVDLWALIYEQHRELSQEEIVKLCLYILEALEYAHKNGVIHRDLKPENVMVVDEDLHVKVTDFGLAYIRGQRRITREGVVAGSAFYMAPEVASGESSDHRSDLYALGVMLYELVTGRLPFYSENPLAVISMHLYDAPRPPSELRPDISPVLEAIILKLLVKRPGDRFTSAAEVHQALENLEQPQLNPESFTQQHLLEQIDRHRPIGRDAEWSHLRECWQEVVLGSGVDTHPVVMIAGEAGSGKNQLVHQLLVEARFTGACVLNTQCFMTAALLPYQPIIEILRQYLRSKDATMNAAMAADLARLVPEIADEFEIEDLPPLSPEAEKLRLYEHITQFVIDIAQQPLLILIEYLHSADSSTLEFLHYLARNIVRLPILIIGTYRPSELDHRHPLDVLLRELISQDLVEQISLHRMSPEEVGVFIEAIFGAGVAPVLAQMIYDKTHGNIFFTREMLKSLVLDGHIYPDTTQNRWRVKEIDAMQLPNSIRSVIRHILGKLSDIAMEVLPIAAVIGHEFSFNLLVTVSEQSEDIIWNVLEEALNARIINEKKNSREEIYAFENLAIHETLLESLHQRTKSRLHLKIARALETRYPHQIQDNIETIARHYSLGARTDEDIDRAIQYLEQAADHASRIFALMNALDLYNNALDLSQDDISSQREARILHLRERRGTVYQQIGDFDAAAADLEAVLLMSPVHHDTSHKRAVLLQLGQVYRRAERFEQAIKTLTDAVEISRTMENETLVADALFFLGATYWSLAEINHALRHQEEAYEIITRLQLE
ncbi:MAG TPA: protein kinase, partial [Aggregatilineales bacterium]|nr:protein kinase [Aggregatilineales bacterium]